MHPNKRIPIAAILNSYLNLIKSLENKELQLCFHNYIKKSREVGQSLFSLDSLQVILDSYGPTTTPLQLQRYLVQRYVDYNKESKRKNGKKLIVSPSLPGPLSVI